MTSSEEKTDAAEFVPAEAFKFLAADVVLVVAA